MLNFNILHKSQYITPRRSA